MQELVDLTADPCNDFFRYACKPTTQENPIPLKRNLIDSLEELVKQPPEEFKYVKKFYQSCADVPTGFTSEEVLAECMKDLICTDEELVDIAGAGAARVYKDFIRHIKEFVNKTAFPVATPDWQEETKDLFGGKGWNWWDFASNIIRDDFFLAAFQYVSREANTDLSEGLDMFRAYLFFVPMIETTRDTNFDDGDLLPKLHMVPMKVSSFLRNGGNSTVIKKYRGFMKILIGFLSGNSTTLDQDIDRIIELELELGQINNQIEFDSSMNSWEIITVEELSMLVPDVEWKDYIQASLKSNSASDTKSCLCCPNLQQGFRVHRYTQVSIPSRDLLQKMGNWIRKIGLRDQANLLVWRMIVMFANNFMHTGVDDGNNLQDNIFTSIEPEARTRPQNCLAQIKTFFPGVEDDMLIAKYVDEETKEYFETLFDSVKQAFGQMVQNSTWMTNRTRQRALEKLNHTKLLIGETLPTSDEFQELKDGMSDNYINNIRAIGNYKWNTLSNSLGKLKLLDRGYEKEENAYYNREFNSVRIKIGLIRNVFGLGFSKELPLSILYGGFVASSLGHELLHGFDTNGRKFDKEGFRLNWWEESDEDAYNERTQCMVRLNYQTAKTFFCKAIDCKIL